MAENQGLKIVSGDRNGNYDIRIEKNASEDRGAYELSSGVSQTPISAVMRSSTSLRRGDAALALVSIS
jgi:hypothetical protein